MRSLSFAKFTFPTRFEAISWFIYGPATSDRDRAMSHLVDWSDLFQANEHHIYLNLSAAGKRTVISLGSDTIEFAILGILRYTYSTLTPRYPFNVNLW